MIDSRTALIAVRCVTLYHYNTSPCEGVQALFGDDIHQTYLSEQIHRWGQGLVAFLGHLNPTNQQRFVQLALDKYASEVAAQYMKGLV